MDFPAPVSDDPATVVAVRTDEPGNVSIQSMAAGSEPDGDVKDKFTVRVPGPLPPEETVSASDCP
jgi:hypothetical protein